MTERALEARRICVLTTGHLATSPRMLKAADAFSEAGAIVHVVSTWNTPWAVDADADIRSRRPGAWSWDVVDFRRVSRATYIRSGTRHRAARSMARLAGVERIPLYVAGAARERVFPEIVRATRGKDLDFVYGGGAGLAAAFYAARNHGVRFGVDLEDFHTGDQHDTADGRLNQDLSGRIERTVLPRAAVITAGSEDIAEAYRTAYAVNAVSINNTFRLFRGSESPRTGGALRIFWFSQTIGPKRGLEDAVSAIGISGIDAELHLQGLAIDKYVDDLLGFAKQNAPNARVFVHPPSPPDDLIDLCSSYDVGLAIEVNDTLSRPLCLSNKALAYTAAGMAVALTDTPGQRRLARDLGAGGYTYESGDVSALARHLSMWASDRSALATARSATRNAATARWNWEHPDEKERLVHSVASALSGSQ